MAVQIQLRRDSAADWASANPVLALGEPGVETDTLKVKVGDGSTAWNSLAYSITTQFADLNGKPTTIAGYGITDALALGTSSTTALAGDTALFSGAFADLTSKPTTIAGYGITDAVASSAISTFGGTLVDDADASAARTTLGLGTAATTAATAYATAAQGATADTAIQPNTSPTLTNATLTGYLAGPASFTIDPAAVGDNTGTVVIAGNLQVDGTQTTINSTTVAIDDLKLSVATDAADSAAANGAGITVGGANANITYTHATTSWDFDKPVNVTGNIGVTGTVDGVDIQTLNTTAGAALPKAGGTMTGRPVLNYQNPEIRFDDSDTSNNGEITLDNASLRIESDPDDAVADSTIKFNVDNDTKMIVLSSGNVGIGVTPSQIFEVQKAADDKLVYGSNPRLVLDTPTGINGLRVLGDTTPFEFKIDSGTYNGSTFSMGGTGDVSLLGTTTTASDTFNDSPTFFFNSMRWNGSANATHFQGAIKGHTRSATNGDGYLGIGADANANHITIETDGTVGVGTTDLDSWSSVFDGRVRLGATGFVGSTSASTQLGNNWYYDGAAYKRIASDLALRYYQNGGDHVWETAVTGAADSTITWATKLLLGSNGNLELGYAGAARQQADSQAFTITTPAAGGGQGIALKRLDSNTDQGLGEISWSNNTQDGLGSISMKTDGAVNTTQMNFEVASAGTAIFPLKLEGGPNTVVINGTTADHAGTGGGSRGLSIATAGGTSCPIYFGTETNAAQKSMYLNGYWIYLRGHQNEGIRFVFSQGGGTAIRSDQYEFKYNSATRPTGNTTWDGFSDARAKENVQNITGALDTISQLRPVVFDWTDDYADTMNMFEMDKTDSKSYNWKSIKENGYDLTRKNGKLGFIAQEFEKVFPKDITELEVQLGDEKVEDFKTVNYDSLIPTLTKAIQEQQAQIQALQQRLDDLEG